MFRFLRSLLSTRENDLELRSALEEALRAGDAARIASIYERAVARPERLVLGPREQFELGRICFAVGRPDLGKCALEDLAHVAPASDEAGAARRTLHRLATRRCGFRTEPRPISSVL